jgi:hypothetical protein
MTTPKITIDKDDSMPTDQGKLSEELDLRNEEHEAAQVANDNPEQWLDH